jgi:hypothetical protein
MAGKRFRIITGLEGNPLILVFGAVPARRVRVRSVSSMCGAIQEGLAGNHPAPKTLSGPLFGCRTPAKFKSFGYANIEARQVGQGSFYHKAFFFI